MQTLLFLAGAAFAIGATGLFALVLGARRAPVGYQDDRGFHYGDRHGRTRGVPHDGDNMMVVSGGFCPKA